MNNSSSFFVHFLPKKTYSFYYSIIVETGNDNKLMNNKRNSTISVHSGNIFCHECSSRSVPLPQLGYGTKAVRVCNSCFEVAYLVTYTIDQDHGVSTQVCFLFFSFYFI